MRESSAKIITILARVLPYICLSLTAVILVVSFAVGRPDFAIKGLYIIIPIAAASAIAIARPGLFKENLVDFLPRLRLNSSSFQYLVLLFTIIYIVSLLLLTGSEARPPAYFILIGIMASLIFFEILASGEEHSGRRNVILFQIILVASNLIFSQTLRLHFYYGWGDVFGHMNYINTILETGRITPAMGDYEYFPNFHIFGAAGTLLSGMDVQTSYFLFNGLVFIISIPVIYLLLSQLTKSAQLPLISTLLYSQSREIIFNGMYMITRVMAFVFCLMILYLLVRSRNNLKLRSLALFLVVPLVLMHQTTLLHFSGILLVLVILEFLLYRPSWYIGFNFFIFFTIAYLGYWFWIGYPFFKETLINYSSANEITRVPFLASELPLFGAFARNADLIVLAFLAILGIIVLLHANRKMATAGAAFSLFSLVAFVLFFPGIASFLANILLTSRLPLLMAPFIAFVAAGGLILWIRHPHTDGKHRGSLISIGISLFLIFAFSTSSAVILGNTTDLNLSKMLGRTNSLYFTESETAAFSFAHRHGQNIPYYGDYSTLRYMHDYLGLSVQASSKIFDPESIKNGYMLFRKQELQSRGQLPFSKWVTPSHLEQEFVYWPPRDVDLQANWEQEDKIFDSGAVYIYMKKTQK